MRQWIRSHLTYANVISTLCLFLVLGGGTAVALRGKNTVQSNDIGPGAQVKAPDIAHNAVNSADIINGQVTNPDILNGAVTTDKLGDGSVGNADLGPNSVTGDKVADNSLTGADIDQSSLTGTAHALIYQAFAPAPLTTIATVGPYAIKGQCADAGGNPQVRLWVNGPDAGTADVMYDATSNGTDSGFHSDHVFLPANTDTQVTSVTGTSVTEWIIAGTAILRTGSTLVQVDFNDSAGGSSCTIYGTATRAT